MEPAAAALAAERRTEADLARMGRALDDMARHGLATPEGRAADRAFHHAVLEATRNAPLLSLSSSIAAAVSWTTLYKQRRRALPRNPMPEHRALHAAIAGGDPVEAREAMSELIRLALADTEMSMKA